MVIAIIAVLVAMLLPALRYAKDIATDTACMNGVRQLGMSTLLYAEDYDGRVPPHWNTGTTGLHIQSTKAPDNRWIIITGHGKVRAALTYPDYADSPKLWYCPTNQYTSYTRRHNDPGGFGYGLKHYPNTGWSSQYYSAYAFPAVKDTCTQSNYGGVWNGNPPNYWDTPNYWQQYGSGGTWSDSMIPKTVEENVRLNNPMMWDYVREGFISHDLRTSSVVYWDGSALSYPHTAYLYYNKIHSSYGARGMVHPSIRSWLVQYRLTRSRP